MLKNMVQPDRPQATTQAKYPFSEMLGNGSVSDFGIFSDFSVLTYYNEIAWGWEPNLNAKSICVSYTAYEYIGFI
jgi:hypothetical protein